MSDEFKTVLITGAGRRIGAALTRHLHQTGYRVALHYGQSQNEAEALAESLNRARPDSATCLQADLSNTEELERLAEHALNQWGRLDVLINNASRFYPTAVGKVTPDIWADLMDTNLKAPFFLAQSLTPAIAETKGCIINIIDIYAERPLTNHPIYSASKAGLAMLTRSLAKELGPDIRVNGISPGAILWPEQEASLSAEQAQKILDKTALKINGSPEDICRSALFLIDSPYITGQIISVDGGRTLNQ